MSKHTRTVRAIQGEAAPQKMSIVEALKTTMAEGALRIGGGTTVKKNVPSAQDNDPSEVIQTDEMDAFQTQVPLSFNSGLQLINAIDIDAIFDPAPLIYKAATNKFLAARDAVQPIKITFDETGALGRALGISATGLYEVNNNAEYTVAAVLGVVRKLDTEVGDAEVTIKAGDLTAQLDLVGDEGKFVLCPLRNAPNRNYTWTLDPGVQGGADASVQVRVNDTTASNEAHIVNDGDGTKGGGVFQIGGINVVVTYYLVPLVDELLPAYHQFAATEDPDANLADVVREYLGFGD